MTEPLTYTLLRQTTSEALHLELRDTYTPNDPVWQDWQQGIPIDAAQRYQPWLDLVTETTARGVSVRRARVVHEPVTDYIRFEYEITRELNLAAGEQVRWLSRRTAWDLLIPACDFWIFDRHTIVLNIFDGNGEKVTAERHDDPRVAENLAGAFDVLWDRAIDHEAYQVG